MSVRDARLGPLLEGGDERLLGEVLGEADVVRDDLEERLTPREVAQTVLPEVRELDPVAEAWLDQRARRSRLTGRGAGT